jgi:hypothetical protein
MGRPQFCASECIAGLPFRKELIEGSGGFEYRFLKGSTMMRNGVAAAALLSSMPALPAMAATCSGTVLLQDAFTTVNPALDVAVYPQTKLTIGGGKAEVSLVQAGFGRTEEYTGLRYGDVNVCVSVSTPATDKAEGQLAGIVFWAVDYGAYYVFEINPANGQYSVAQRVEAGTWTYPIAATASTAITQGMGATNTLEVQTRGTTATFLINGQQVGTVTGTPPAGGGLVGFYGCSQTTATGTDTFDFSNFSASSPQTTTATASAACPGTMIFQDAFASPDANLNLAASAGMQFTTQGGKGELTIQQANWGQMVEYAGLYGDADVCATFGTQATDKAEGQMAGLIFWAADYNNLYLLEFNVSTGQFEFAQRTGGNWVLTATSTPSAAVEKGMGKTNTLRVQTKGTVATLYVNGQQVETLSGQPPAGGGYVGFYAESEAAYTAKETWDIANFTVAMP